MGYQGELDWRLAVFLVFSKFPHFWVNAKSLSHGYPEAEYDIERQKSRLNNMGNKALT